MIIVEDDEFEDLPFLPLNRELLQREYTETYHSKTRASFLNGLASQWQRHQFIDCYVSSCRSEATDENNEQSAAMTRYPAHKIVIASQSSLLSDLMNSQVSQQNSQDGVMELTVDEDPVILKKMISFMYTGEVTLSNSNVMNIFVCARRYGCEDLQGLCEEHVSKMISTHSVVQLLIDAHAYQALTLYQKCLEYMNEYAESVLSLRRKELVRLPKQCLIDVLKLNFCMDEHMIVEIVKDWALANGADELGYQQVLTGVIECIRLVSLSKKCLRDEILPMGIVSNDVLLEVLFKKAKDPPHLLYSRNPSEQECKEDDGKLWLRPRRSEW